MTVFIRLKSMAKRQPAPAKAPYNLPDSIATLRELIETVVRQEAAAYNSRGTDNPIVPFLTEGEIAERAEVGKIAFGRLYSDKKADPEKAVKTALLGFADGLFRVLVDDREIKDLDECLTLRGATPLPLSVSPFWPGGYGDRSRKGVPSHDR